MPFFFGARKPKKHRNAPTKPYPPAPAFIEFPPSSPPPTYQQAQYPPQQYQYYPPQDFQPAPQFYSQLQITNQPHSSTVHLQNPPVPHTSLPYRPLQGPKYSSCTNLPAVNVPPPSSSPARGAALYDLISDTFSDVISLIDQEIMTSDREIVYSFESLPSMPSPAVSPPPQNSQLALRGGEQLDGALVHHRPGPPPRGRIEKRPPDKQSNILSKLDFYANSRVPAELPPLRVYIPTYPLLCLAARYSNNAYRRPTGAEKEAYVNADARLGTKAMMIKSVPIDDMNTIVFAIRGTSLLSLRDWGINFRTSPVRPTGFLDDSYNLCHEGFLAVAKSMVYPIASRLRHLLEENPSRSACSLLITGHSAGGAVAALLYSHMLAETVTSELNILTGCFKRIHCITFGAPPVTLLPLCKPPNSERRLRKSVFLSFINEGDPVARAEKAYIKSLIELLASPAPKLAARVQGQLKAASTSHFELGLKKQDPRAPKLPPRRPGSALRNVFWRVPDSTLSNAGRVVVLRAVPYDKGRREDITASIVTDAQLRPVIFGNPLMHSMDLYARRIEILATKAVTGKVAC